MMAVAQTAKEKLSIILAEYPLRVRTAVGIAIGVIGSTLIALGLDAAELGDKVENVALLAFDVLVITGVVKKSEAAVTPMANPKLDDGTPLVALPEPIAHD